MSRRAARDKNSRLVFEVIEDQVLYSAEVLGGLDVAAVVNYDDAIIQAGLLPGDRQSSSTAEKHSQSLQLQQSSQSYEVVFVDTNAADYQVLVDDILESQSDQRRFDVYILSNASDGIEQISDVLSGYESLDAVHVISHGVGGAINIGSTELNSEALDANATAVAAWGDAFDTTGDFLLYGCDLASTVLGQDFVDKLAKLTDTDVAASEDLTGHALFGGNWDLEYRKGDVKTSTAPSIEFEKSWAKVLAGPGNHAPTSIVPAWYLSDLIPSATDNIHGGVQNDRAWIDGPVEFDGVLFHKAISTHAPNSSVGYVEYDIDGATSFKATIGVADNFETDVTYGSVIMRVYVDGVLQYTSGTLSDSSAPIDLDIDTSGGTTIRLEVDRADTSYNHDHASWASARLEGGTVALKIVENSSNGTIVGSLNRVDPDWGDNASYALTDSAAGIIAIDANTGELTVANNEPLNFEVHPSLDVTVQVTDSGGLTYSEIITIEVTDEAEAPLGVRVESPTILLDENFDDGDALGWTLPPNTSVSGGKLVSTTNTADMKIVWSDPAALVWSDYSTNVEIDVRDNDPQGLMIRVQDELNYIKVFVLRGTHTIVAQKVVDGVATEVASANGLNYFYAQNDQKSGVHQLTVHAIGEDYTVELNGVEVLAFTDNTYTSGTVGLYFDFQTGSSSFDNIRVTEAPISVTENSSNGTVIGYAHGIDVDAGTVLNYALSNSANSRFAIDAVTGEITVSDGYRIDFESALSHDIDIVVTDAQGGSYTKALTIQVLDSIERNVSPSDISSGIELNSDSGNDAYLVANDGGALLGGLSQFTTEITFVSNTVSDTPLISYGSATASDLSFSLLADGTASISINNVDGGVLTGMDYATLMDGELHSVALSWDNTNGRFFIYVDGILTDSGSGVAQGTTIAGASASGTLVFGQSQGSVGGGYQPDTILEGTLYDIRIWNTVRSAAELALNYQQTVDLTPSEASLIGLIANWQMNGFNGSNEVVDIVGANNLSIAHVSGGIFTPSTPVSDLHVTENAAAGLMVGYVQPVKPSLIKDIVIDGLFTEAPDPNYYTGYTSPSSLGGWTVEAGTVELLGTFIGESPLGSHSVDMNGSSAGTLLQTLSVEDGRQYQVTFALTGNYHTSPATDTNLLVSVDDVSFEVTHLREDNWVVETPIWGHRTFNFTASGSTADLRFQGLDVGNSGVIIADVQVIEISQSISTILNNDPTLTYDAVTGKFYRYVTSAVDFSTAQSSAIAAQLNGTPGQLLTINTAIENERIQNLINSSAWLGASDATVEGEWRWFDEADNGEQFWSGGAAGSALGGQYANWISGSQPDNGGASEHYAEIRTDGTWNDLSSQASREYVIEWDANEVVSGYTFSLVDPSGNFDIHSSTGKITATSGNTLDVDTASSHNVEVQVTDAAGNSYTKTMVIVVDADMAPSDVISTHTTEGGLTINGQSGLGDSYLQATNGGDVLGGLGAVTIEWQFESMGLSFGSDAIIHYATAAHNEELRIFRGSGGALNITLGETAIDVSSFDFNSLDDGQVHALAFSWDNANGDWAIYVDGSLEGSGTGLAIGKTFTTGGDLVFGQQFSNYQGGFNTHRGWQTTLHDIRIFNDIRTSFEIAANYRSNLEHDEPGMLANWTFADLSLEGVTTDTVKGNNLTIGHTGEATHVADIPFLTFEVNENASNGSIVGQITSLDAEREARVAFLLAADSELLYSAEAGKFYKLVVDGIDWSVAETTALSNNLNGVSGQLATVRSATESAIMEELHVQLGAALWLGGTASTVDEQWRWREAGADADTFWNGNENGYAPTGVYSNFSSGEPNNPAENYLATWNYGSSWNDANDFSSGSVGGYVVEWKADDVLDATDPLTYAIDSQTVAGAFTVDASTGQLTVANNALLDYENNTTHTLTVRTTDFEANTHDQIYVIALSDLMEVDDTPTGISSGIELNTDGGNAAYLLADNGGAMLGGLDSYTAEFSFATHDSGTLTLLSYVASPVSDQDDELRIALHQAGVLNLHSGNVGADAVNLSGFDYNSLRDGQMHSLAISWDNSSGSINVFVDGERVDGSTGFRVGETLDTGGTLVLGGEQDSENGGFDSNEIFSGTLYDVRIWNEARTVAEIALNYQSKLDLTPSEAVATGLVANWQMDGFDGTNEVVDSVSGNNLSINQASGAGFISSTPVGDLHVSENAMSGAIVGFVKPSEPNVVLDVVSDGLFTQAIDPGGFQYYGSVASLGGWTVEEGDVELLGSFFGESPQAGRSIDLNGTVAGSLLQTLTVEQGREYQVIFALNGNYESGDTNRSLRVSADGQSVEFNHEKEANWSKDTPVWGHRSFTFTASGPTSDLRFQSLESGGVGPVIADIQVFEIPQAVTTILNSDSTLSYDAATDKFYKTVNVQTDYETVQAAAIGTNLNGVSGQLVTIRSQYENELVRSFAAQIGRNIWLGATDEGVEGDWRWQVGTEAGDLFWQGDQSGTTQAGTYNNWRTSQPDNAGGMQNWVKLYKDTGVWDDVSSIDNGAYIVEWSASDVLSSYTYNLSDPSSIFAIDSSTGAITVSAGGVLDFEVATTHEVTVSVANAAGRSYSDTISIKIDNGIDASQSVPGAQSVNEDEVLTFSSANTVPNAVTVSDTVASSNSLMQVLLAVNDGVLNLSQTSGLSFLDGGNGAASMIFQGAETDINAALEGMTFTPNAQFNGSDALIMSTSLSADLQGHYTFEGGNANDQSAGTLQNGTFTGNAATVVDNTRGEVLSLDGDGDVVDIVGVFGEPVDITLSAWVNLTAADSAGAEVISLGDDIQLRLDSSGVDGIILDVRGAGGYSRVSSGQYIAGTGWHHVAATFDDINNIQVIYLDGKVIATSNISDSIAYRAGGNTVIGGHGGGGTGNDFNGQIDDARVYSRALSAEEIAVLITAQSDAIDFIFVTVDAVNDAPIGAVTIDNTNPSENDLLTASNTLTDEDGLGAISYQWQRDGVDIVGAVGLTYTTTQADVNTAIRVVASYSDGQGTSESVPSTATSLVSNVNDAPTGTVTIDNLTPSEDDLLTASNTLADEDGLGAISYQWQRDSVDIVGAVGSTYVAIQADVNTAIRVVASYSDGQGTSESVPSTATSLVSNVNDAPTGTVTIDNLTPSEDDLLTASNTLTDEDGLGAISYQWQRDSVDIVGAVGSTYTTTQADVNTAIHVVASYSDSQGTSESVPSTATSLVGNVNDAPTGTVSIDNLTPSEDDLLTASNTLADEDGLGAISYQWQRDSVDIVGAVGSTYVAIQADVNTAIRVVASYSDGQGTSESVPSTATSLVGNVNDAPTGTVTIDNLTPSEDDLLTASNTLTDEDGLGAISYQWQRDNVDIVGAVGSTYVAIQADVNTAIRVVASYSDGQGTSESVFSATTSLVSNVNDAPTGTVSIDNLTPSEDDLLTASNTLADEDGLGAISYQWQRDGVDILGAVGSTYTTTQADVNTAIRVVASYSDGQGTSESVPSTATSLVSNVNDAPTGTVTIDNLTPSEDDLLTASNTLADEDGLGAISYQWQRDNVDIVGAVGSTYVAIQADVNTAIRVVASYSDGQGTSESVFSATTSLVSNVNDAPTGTVTIDNLTPSEDDLLTASNTLTDEDGLGAISYQWQRDGVDIVGAVGLTYTTTQADVDTIIRVIASYTDGQSTTETVTSTATSLVSNVNDAPTGTVTIDNLTPSEDDLLTASNTLADEDGLGAISYQWQRDSVDIVGAVGSTYVAIQADVNTAIRVVASYSDGQGTSESVFSATTSLVSNVNDAPTGTVTIDNLTPSEDDLLTASNTLTDEDGLGAISYQWQRDNVDIVGAVGSTYVAIQADVNTAIRVVASYSDGQGTSESVFSATTSLVSNVNDAPTGTVSIDNLTPSEDDLLTASNTLADEDGLGAISYQWQRDGVDIVGAVGSTYTTTQADVNTAIRVVASYSDGQGTSESVPSTATSLVGNINDAPTGTVTIDNLTPSEDDLLTASNTLADEDGLGAISYQWQRDGVDIVGAVGSTYTTTQADVNTAIRVVASYSDGQGTSESVPSTATSLVSNVNDTPTGAVMIDNTTPAEDDLLTVSNTLADQDGLGTISYQWQRDSVDIVGASGATYTTTQADIDTVIRVIASYTDGQGTVESVPSNVTALVANVNDTPSGSVAIDNTTPSQGDLLTASNTLTDEDGLGAISYQWQRDGVDIVAATASTYSVVQADVGSTVRVVASYTDGEGTQESVVSGATLAIENVNDAPTGSVTIDNTTPSEDDQLTASNTLADEDGINTVTYQWQRDGVNVAGAIGSTYTTIQTDVGTAIRVIASYTDAEGTLEAVSSLATSMVANVNDVPTGTVTIDNTTPNDGDLLTATNTLADEDGLGTISHQWQRDGVDIVGATVSTYSTVQADVGSIIGVVASYTDEEGTQESIFSNTTSIVGNVNDAPTGSVSIDNPNPQENNLLTVTDTLADKDGVGTISYQWQRDGANIIGATTSTYNTVQADVGATIRVVASYIDGQGTSESVASSSTSAVANETDAPTGTVNIDNTSPVEDDFLTATNNLADEDGLGTISYQWQRDGVDIVGAVGSTYSTVQADVGTAIRVVASYTDGQGTPESVLSAETSVVSNVNDAPTGSVTINNTNPNEDDLLTASHTLADEDGLGAISYQWQRDGVDVIGADSLTYAVSQSDVGTAIRVVASYIDEQGHVESVQSVVTALVVNLNDSPNGTVSIDNTNPSEKDVLTASNTLADEDGLGAISYQWQRDGVDIVGANLSTYSSDQSDVDTAIRVIASYTDGYGTTESLPSSATAIVVNVNDAPTGVVLIDNTTPSEGDTLIASNTLGDEDGLGTVVYQWQRDGVDISGATASSYTTVQTDVGTAIRLLARYTDDHGTVESVLSDSTTAVVNVNDAPTGTVSIDSGNPAEGDLLSASNSLIDEDGIGPISYQWQRDGVDILGANSSIYSTIQTDVGTAIRVVASYVDDQGTSESALSNATAPVNNVNDAPTGTVAIDNTNPREGDLLNASNTLNDEDGLGLVGYQWQRDGVDILGANSASYTTIQNDVGTAISVLASYTDDQGTSESVPSALTTLVGNVNDAPTGTVLIDNTAPLEGDTLTASNTLSDEDGLGTISYQWQRDGVDITGENLSVFTTAQVDVGTAISVLAKYTDSQGTAESVQSATTSAVVNVNDTPTGSVVINNMTPSEGELLTASNTLADEDGIGAISYQWQRDGVDIVGANLSTYTTIQNDVGRAIHVVANYTDNQGAVESVSSLVTANVANTNDAPTGTVAIDNTNPREGDLLNASNTLNDEDGVGLVSYQWQRDGVDILGANSASYTTIQNDVGTAISVLASYTDDQGTSESVPSALTTLVGNVNDAPTGTVLIDNTAPLEGDTLTASNTLSDEDGLGTISYQWQRDGVDITGENLSVFTTAQVDVGTAISVLAKYTDSQGTAESVQSATTSAVVNVNDTPTGSVVIDNMTPSEGELLTASNTLADEDGIGAISYQWQRDGVDIVGANLSTYTTIQNDVGRAIHVVANYTDNQGAVESVSSLVTANVANTNDAPTGTVAISDTNPSEDDLLVASNTLSDEDGLGTISYQWQRDGVDIVSANSPTYTTVQTDVGSTISVVANYTDGQGAAESVLSAATSQVANVNDAPTGSVSIDNISPDEGDLLTASNTVSDEDGLGAIVYQWQRDGDEIVGTNASTYTTVQSDVGKPIRVLISYTDDQGTLETVLSVATSSVANVNDAPTGTVSIDNTDPAEGDLLTASNTLADEDSLGAISYQWQKDGVAIAGADSPTYSTVQSDVGTAIRVLASYMDGQGTSESMLSTATSFVGNVNDAPTGSVVIDNTSPSEDDLLTASHTLADEDGLGAISYQWQRDGLDIVGENSLTYRIAQADVGSKVRVLASYTDGQGRLENVPSATTASVINVNDAPSGTVTINSTTPSQGEVLTASNTLTDTDGLGTVSYQWQRDGINIVGATSPTYTTIQADTGKPIRVLASYTDDQGTPESVLSVATNAVANINDAPAGVVSIDNMSPAEDDLLTASNTLTDDDGLGTVSYQWQRDGINIAGATDPTYTIVSADASRVIRVIASYIDDGGASESVASSSTVAVGNINDEPTGSVIIDNIIPTEGDLLTASNTLADEDGLGSISYQWQRDGSNIVGATDAIYATSQTDVDSAIRVLASYTDAQGTLESVFSSASSLVGNINDTPVGSVSIDNTNPREGEPLTVSHTLADEDGLGIINYQWQRDGIDIEGATTSAYSTSQADVGKSIVVKANYTDAQGTAESVSSAASLLVVNVNNTPTGVVVIDDTAPNENQVLSATNTLADIDGLTSVSYQWQRDGLNITGASNSTYSTISADIGNSISVIASYIDAQGTPESVTSAQAALVANVNDTLTGIVSIDNTTPNEGDKLTASSVLDDNDGIGVITYHWQRGGVDIPEAVGSTYTVVQTDVDLSIRVVATHVDGQGTEETLSSAPTSPVANVNNIPTGAVFISNTSPLQNSILTASNSLADKDSLGVVGYQWQRDGVNIVGAIDSTYTTAATDVESTIRVIASYTDGYGTVESIPSASTAAVGNINDAPSGAVTIDNTSPSEGDKLTASNSLADKDGIAAIFYQWQRDGVDISDSTNPTYIVTREDVGSAISVVASYTDGHDTLEQVTSAITDIVKVLPVTTDNAIYAGSEGDSVAGRIAFAAGVEIDSNTTFDVTKSPANGVATIDSVTGMWVFTPTNMGWFGVDNFSVDITDEFGNVVTQVINIYLVEANTATIIGSVDSAIAPVDGETTDNVVFSSSGLIASSSDAGEPGFQPAITAGAFGSFEIEASGDWKYSAQSNQIRILELDAGQKLTETVIVTATDGTTQAVQIDIIGKEDAPVISGIYEGSVSNEGAAKFSNTLSITDVDLSDNPISFTDVESTQSDNQFGYFTMSAGVWSYTVDATHPSVQSLGFNELLNDTFTVWASDGSSQIVTIVIEGRNKPLPPQAATAVVVTQTELTAAAENVDAVNIKEALEGSEYDWMGAVATLVAPAVEEPAAIIKDDTKRLAPEDPITLSDDAIMIYGEESNESREVNSKQNSIGRHENGRQPPKNVAIPPIQDLLALNLVLAPVQGLQLEAEQYDIVVNEKASRDKLIHATQTMREQMSDAQSTERRIEEVAELVLRVSGVTLSAGSLAWVLHGGALFATALSTIPTWQGFDPLPVVARKPKPRRWDRRKWRKDEHAVDMDESVAGSILDSAPDAQKSSQV